MAGVLVTAIPAARRGANFAVHVAHRVARPRPCQAHTPALAKLPAGISGPAPVELDADLIKRLEQLDEKLKGTAIGVGHQRQMRACSPAPSCPNAA